MALRHNLTYVEGYAVSGSSDSLYAIHHAWCIDDRGFVLDRTWSGGTDYLGVPFKLTFLAAYLLRHPPFRPAALGKGLINDWPAHWPLLREFADKPEMWLAAA